jgi:eukaryotic-like serine/threonine-protein kinase
MACSKVVPPSYELPRPGAPFDRYDVLCRVAFGGMAAVYGVRRSSIGGFDKLLAMKVMLPHLADRRDAVDMFLDEGRIAAHIDHPNVLEVFDVAEMNGMPFMIMEYVRGQSLSRILTALESGAPLPLQLVVLILQKAAEGLHGAHETTDIAGESLRIVHRDVSPQNIMVSYDGDVKVVDFGIAAGRGRIASTRSGELKGKLGYVPPEAISKSRPLDRRADVWGMGVVAWEALAGRRLFADEDDAATLWNVMHGEVERLSALRDDLPPALVRCVHRCLERDADQRPATCAAVADELAAVVTGLGGAGREMLARHMGAIFEGEQQAERDRIVAIMAGAPDPEADSESKALAEARSTEGTDVTAETPATAPRATDWRPLSAAAVALVVGMGIAAVVAQGDAGPNAATSATTSPAAEVHSAREDVVPTIPTTSSAAGAQAPGASVTPAPSTTSPPRPRATSAIVEPPSRPPEPPPPPFKNPFDKP